MKINNFAHERPLETVVTADVTRDLDPSTVYEKGSHTMQRAV